MATSTNACAFLGGGARFPAFRSDRRAANALVIGLWSLFEGNGSQKLGLALQWVENGRGLHPAVRHVRHPGSSDDCTARMVVVNHFSDSATLRCIEPRLKCLALPPFRLLVQSGWRLSRR